MANILNLQQRIYCVKNYYSTENYNTVCSDFERDFHRTVRRQTIRDIVGRFEEFGSVEDKRRSGRPLSVNTQLNRQVVSETILQEPKNSSRKLSKELQIKRSSLQNIIKSLGLKVWRPRLIQELNEDDPDRRMEFCEQFEVLFPEEINIMFTDEASFKLNGTVNRHNCVYYANENPHMTFEKSVNSPGVMVWAGICPTKIIGPYFFDKTVTGESYLEMLNTYAIPHMRQMDNNLWWQQDGAPPHFSRIVRDRLDKEFAQRWIGRRGPLEWPPRSPDLNPLDYAVWGIIKENVYKNRVNNLDQLRNRISTAFEIFNEQLCYDICESIRGRVKSCMNEDGRQFEHKRQ